MVLRWEGAGLVRFSYLGQKRRRRRPEKED